MSLPERSIYDITYDNVDNSDASFWEAHSTSNISSNWGGTKSSFPDLTGADKDLFGVFSFGGGSGAAEFGGDYHARYGSYHMILVSGVFDDDSAAGVFYRHSDDWADSHRYCGGRAMAYPGTAPDVKAKIVVTANGGGGTPESQSVVVDSGTTFGDAAAKLTQPTKTGHDFIGWA